MNSTDKTSDTTSRQRRQYLPAIQRKKELLDAALMEFSSHGYGAATIERIAARAGLSKAGLYAHYKSKEEMFEDLLITRLAPVFPSRAWFLEDGVRLDKAVETFIEQIYARLGDPTFLAMVRLLTAESGRAPQLIQRWRKEVIQPYMDQEQKIIDECVARGLMRDCALTRHFSLAVAPMLFAAHWLLVFGGTDEQEEIARIRNTHREIVLDLLVTKPSL